MMRTSGMGERISLVVGRIWARGIKLVKLDGFNIDLRDLVTRIAWEIEQTIDLKHIMEERMVNSRVEFILRGVFRRSEKGVP